MRANVNGSSPETVGYAGTPASNIVFDRATNTLYVRQSLGNNTSAIVRHKLPGGAPRADDDEQRREWSGDAETWQAVLQLCGC